MPGALFTLLDWRRLKGLAGGRTNEIIKIAESLSATGHIPGGCCHSRSTFQQTLWGARGGGWWMGWKGWKGWSGHRHLTRTQTSAVVSAQPKSRQGRGEATCQGSGVQFTEWSSFLTFRIISFEQQPEPERTTPRGGDWGPTSSGVFPWASGAGFPVPFRTPYLCTSEWLLRGGGATTFLVVESSERRRQTLFLCS